MLVEAKLSGVGRPRNQTAAGQRIVTHQREVSLVLPFGAT